MSKFRFPTDISCVKSASQKVLDELKDLEIDENILFDMKLAFEEALINAMKHGNKLNAQLHVDAEVIKREDEVEITVCDQGEGFDHARCSDPTKNENLEKTNGRGVFLIKKAMDRVVYEKNGSCVRMIKKIK